ncbi:MAG: hypothetical protein IJW12_05615 [Opitutales bacterium]|nr:hypothetical protein [Opitutales bacterium]
MEIPIKDNGGYLEIAPVVRTDWKARCAELERKNDGLLRYAAACCRRQHEAEMRLAESERDTAATLARAESGARYWRGKFERAEFERSRLRVLIFATAGLCVLAGAALILSGGCAQ